MSRNTKCLENGELESAVVADGDIKGYGYSRKQFSNFVRSNFPCTYSLTHKFNSAVDRL